MHNERGNTTCMGRWSMAWVTLLLGTTLAVLPGVTNADESCLVDLNKNGAIDTSDVWGVYNLHVWCAQNTTNECADYFPYYPALLEYYDLDRDFAINMNDVWVSYNAWKDKLTCADMNPATGLPWGLAGCAIDEHCLGEGETCEWCATSSCPFCDDCVPACVVSGPQVCEDAAGVDFGMCEMVLGYTVVDGQCTFLSGCGDLGYTFYNTYDKCVKNCGDIWIETNKDRYFVGDQGISELHNDGTLMSYLPGCSVFYFQADDDHAP